MSYSDYYINCCDRSDYFSGCGTGSDDCSTGSVYSQRNLGKALCPHDENECGDQIRYLGYSSENQVIFKTLSAVPTTSTCHYHLRLYNWYDDISYNLTIQSISNANIEVYRIPNYEEYTYVDTLSEHQYLELKNEDNDYYYTFILVPTGSAAATVEFTVIGYQQPEAEDQSESDSTWIIILVVISLVFVLIICL